MRRIDRGNILTHIAIDFTLLETDAVFVRYRGCRHYPITTPKRADRIQNALLGTQPVQVVVCAAGMTASYLASDIRIRIRTLKQFPDIKFQKSTDVYPRSI